MRLFGSGLFITLRSRACRSQCVACFISVGNPSIFLLSMNCTDSVSRPLPYQGAAAPPDGGAPPWDGGAVAPPDGAPPPAGAPAPPVPPCAPSGARRSSNFLGHIHRLHTSAINLRERHRLDAGELQQLEHRATTPLDNAGVEQVCNLRPRREHMIALAQVSEQELRLAHLRILAGKPHALQLVRPHAKG